MKKMMMCLFALPFSAVAVANNNIVEEGINAGICAADSLAERIAPSDSVSSLAMYERYLASKNDKDVSLQTLGTYKNWLGETCIDFGPTPKSYYNWKRDITFAGAPIFLSSFIIKHQKRAFRSARFYMEGNWKSKVDNYTQFAPYAAIAGMKLLGYQGRSSVDRFVTSALMSNAIMALAVNATKYSVKEMRPDNSKANSYPSGHTATAFTAATILHKEYGLTRSPWFSVAGYAVATSTGFMRVLNNRHWISDVMAGAGIGILSTELGYFMGDLIFKNKGITRLELEGLSNSDRPSFFDLQMGVGIHKNNMIADYDDGDIRKLELGTSAVVGVEGAYFFNKYIGVGGLARVTTTPIRGLGLQQDEREAIFELNDVFAKYDLPGLYNIKTTNNNLIDCSFDVGVYGNLPLSKHFSLGAKALVGARVNGGFTYQATTGYTMIAKDANGNDIYTSTGMDQTGKPANWQPVLVFENADGTLFNSNETLRPGVSTEYNFHLDPDRFQSDAYNMVELTGGVSMNCVFGLSATYRYKDNFSWKIFMDYDMTRNEYDYRLHLFDDKTKQYINGKNPAVYQAIVEVEKEIGDVESSFTSRFNLFTIGASFTVNF